jgi:hypothetical protein
VRARSSVRSRPSSASPWWGGTSRARRSRLEASCPAPRPGLPRDPSGAVPDQRAGVAGSAPLRGRFGGCPRPWTAATVTTMVGSGANPATPPTEEGRGRRVIRPQPSDRAGGSGREPGTARPQERFHGQVDMRRGNSAQVDLIMHDRRKWYEGDRSEGVAESATGRRAARQMPRRSGVPAGIHPRPTGTCSATYAPARRAGDGTSGAAPPQLVDVERVRGSGHIGRMVQRHDGPPPVVVATQRPGGRHALLRGRTQPGTSAPLSAGGGGRPAPCGWGAGPGRCARP